MPWTFENVRVTNTRGLFIASGSAFSASLSALTSSALPLPMKNFGFGRSMRAFSVPTTLAPAERASSRNSDSASGSLSPTHCGCTSRARSPLRERSNRVCDKSALDGFDGRGVGVLFVLGANAHVAARHDGGNGVLVDHLADRIAQQHDELVEGFHRSLQLDAVHEIDRHRDALAAQGVQKRVLQRLTFGHGSSPFD